MIPMWKQNLMCKKRNEQISVEAQIIDAFNKIDELRKDDAK
jgi:hypothetical protein